MSLTKFNVINEFKNFLENEIKETKKELENVSKTAGEKLRLKEEEEIKKLVEAFFKKHDSAVKVDISKIEPVKKPDLDAYLVAQSVVDQLERRIPHKRVVNQTMSRVMNSGAKGVRIMLGGRIAGAEISRKEKYS